MTQGTNSTKVIPWEEARKVSEDVSKAETQEVDTSKAGPPKGTDSVHEQTREKAREEREKIEQESTREQVERNREDGLEAPPGD